MEEEDQMDRSDICSQINLISSIQYQKSELSKLATLLQSETDREKYIKVIQMSMDIQTKLDALEQKKPRQTFKLLSTLEIHLVNKLRKRIPCGVYQMVEVVMIQSVVAVV